MDNSVVGAAKTLAGFAYSDINKLAQIKAQGPAGIRAAAQQFESMFIDMVMGSMRDATNTFADGDYTSSETTRMQQDMLDHQWAIHIAEHGGIGLADIIVRQLGGDGGAPHGAGAARGLTMARDSAASSVSAATNTAGTPAVGNASTGGADAMAAIPTDAVAMDTMPLAIPPEPTPQSPIGLPSGPSNGFPNGLPNGFAVAPPDAIVRHSSDGADDDPLTVTEMGTKDSAFDDPDDFVAKVLPVLQHALAGSGLNPLWVLAQGALETGWGAHVIHTPAGDSTHNLFNIKASSDWAGESVDVSTVEVRGGRPIQQRDRFRSYDSVEDAARDYVSLLKGDERYRRALDAAQDPARFADALQKAGYATDPNYAAKIVRVLTSGPLRDAAATFGVK